jgi:hypothetical protein
VTVDEKENDKGEVRGRRHLLHVLYCLLYSVSMSLLG